MDCNLFLVQNNTIKINLLEGDIMLSSNIRRLTKICDFIVSEKMRILCRGDNQKAFTRDRALPFYDVLYLSLVKKGITLSTELYNWFKIKKGVDFMPTTEEAYLKQRRNLNPDAFKALNTTYMEDFYNLDEKILDNGYIVLAIDGTDFEIPNTPSNREYFGETKNQFNSKPLARASASAIFDINNNFILDLVIDKYRTSEIIMAKKNIDQVLSIIGTQKLLVICDRGYPSLDFFHYLEQRNIKFIIRLTNKDYKAERSAMKSHDEMIQIKHLYSRLQHIKKNYPKTYEELVQKEYTELRIVKTILDSGAEEILITNLSKDDFTTEHIIHIYGQRWGVEESFNTLKNKLKIEQFTGYSHQFIYQDLYAQTFVYNMLQDMMRSAEMELQTNIKKKQKVFNRQYKNQRQINENRAIGLMKGELIHILLCEDNQLREERYRKLVTTMQRYTSVVRKERPATPRIWNKTNKNSTNQKSSF